MKSQNFGEMYGLRVYNLKGGHPVSERKGTHVLSPMCIIARHKYICIHMQTNMCVGIAEHVERTIKCNAG